MPFGGSPLWDLLVYHVTIAAPYPGGIDPRLAVYARSWDGHYTTTRRDRLPTFSKLCMRSRLFKFCVRVADAQSFCSNETLWLMATGKATRRPFSAKPVLTFSGPRIGSVRASCFVDDFVSCWKQAECISVAAWTQLKLASYYFVRLVAWLFAGKGPSAFCSP